MTEQKIAIYIPSHNREELCKKLVSNLRTFDKEIPIYVVTDKSQGYGDIHPEEDNRGISYARNFCVRHAKEQEYTHILMTNDDIYFKQSPIGIFKHFENNILLAQVGIYFDASTKTTKIYKNSGLKYCFSTGNMSFVIDIEKVIEVGNYSEDYIFTEEIDLTIRLFQSGYYKAFDTDIQGKYLKFNSNGGCNSFNYNEIFQKSVIYIQKKYGNKIIENEKINKNNRYIIHWKKLFDLCNKIDRSKIDEYRNRYKIKKPGRSLFDF